MSAIGFSTVGYVVVDARGNPLYGYNGRFSIHPRGDVAENMATLANNSPHQAARAPFRAVKVKVETVKDNDDESAN